MEPPEVNTSPVGNASVSIPLSLRFKAASVLARVGRRTRVALAVLVLTPTLTTAVSVATPLRAYAYNCNGANYKQANGPNGAYDQLYYVWNANPYPNCGWMYYEAYTLNGWGNVGYSRDTCKSGNRT